jgi:hypothetical protein
VACYGCPYLQNYDVIWRDASDSTIMCVMLWCCAGPELQIRRGDEIVVDEFFSTRDLVYERAEQLRVEGWTNSSLPQPLSAATPT